MKLDQIVIGMDLGAPSVAAATWAATSIAPAAQLVLVHAVSLPTPPRMLHGRFADTTETVANAELGALSRMHVLARSLEAERKGPPVIAEVRDGEAAAVILDAAARHSADLVVLAQHVPRGAPWDWIGSTAERILLDGARPVLMVSHPPKTTPRTLLVALDQGEVTPWVVRWSSLLAERFSSDVRGLHVSELFPFVQGPALGPAGASPVPADPDLLDRTLKTEAAAWLERLVAGGLEPARTSCDVVVGDPVREILEAARTFGAELIILGNRRSGRRLGKLFGSTARGVLRRAACPVLVVTEPIDDLRDDQKDEREQAGAAAAGPEHTGQKRILPPHTVF